MGRFNQWVHSTRLGSSGYVGLSATGQSQEMFHQEAAEITRNVFGNKVFVRAVVEVSNFCRENCVYCGMRRDNRALHRYRAKAEQLAEMLLNHLPASVTDVNIQAGEDPVAVREVVIPLIKTLHAQTKLGISVCLGTLSPELYREMKAAGASIYIMKFECASPARYKLVESPGTLESRISHIRLLAESGWRVSSGFITGLPGQPVSELELALELANQLPLSGCSVSPFVPGESTPYAAEATSDLGLTLNCIASIRHAHPDWVIPAVSAFNLAAKDGYRQGIRAGANLTTINLTPDEFRKDYVIYKRDRFIMNEERVLSAIEQEGLVPSTESLAEHYHKREPVTVAPAA